MSAVTPKADIRQCGCGVTLAVSTRLVCSVNILVALPKSCAPRSGSSPPGCSIAPGRFVLRLGIAAMATIPNFPTTVYVDTPRRHLNCTQPLDPSPEITEYCLNTCENLFFGQTVSRCRKTASGDLHGIASDWNSRLNCYATLDSAKLIPCFWARHPWRRK